MNKIAITRSVHAICLILGLAALWSSFQYAAYGLEWWTPVYDHRSDDFRGTEFSGLKGSFVM